MEGCSLSTHRQEPRNRIIMLEVEVSPRGSLHRHGHFHVPLSLTALWGKSLSRLWKRVSCLLSITSGNHETSSHWWNMHFETAHEDMSAISTHYEPMHSVHYKFCAFLAVKTSFNICHCFIFKAKTEIYYIRFVLYRTSGNLNVTVELFHHHPLTDMCFFYQADEKMGVKLPPLYF